MFAAYAARIDKEKPLDGLELGDRPEPRVPPGWTAVTVKAASLNHHDLWSLRGVGLSEESLPMILGCDAAGVDEDGNEVVVHSVIGQTGHGVGPREPRSILTERYQGSFAERVAVPQWNVLPKPKELSFEEAACLPTAWLTAYRMLFTNAGVSPGDTVLVQGAGGGVATAAIVLGAAAGLRVIATSREEAKRERALALGAEAALEPGARLPRRADAVLETVGAATWSHSVKSLRPGGTLVISGATSGPNPCGRRAEPHLLPGAEGRRLHHGDEGGAGLAAELLRRQERAAGHRLDAAAGPGPRGLREDGGGRPVRQGRPDALRLPQILRPLLRPPGRGPSRSYSGSGACWDV